MENQKKIDLDNEERIHLALKAISLDDHSKALMYLKEAVQFDPNDANATYMLAAEYQDLGMVDKAINGLNKAIQLKPDLYIASFQLGMLYFSLGETDACLSTLQTLESLDDSNPIKCFVTAMFALKNDDEASCRHWIQQGVEINLENPALNEMMAVVLDILDEG